LSFVIRRGFGLGLFTLGDDKDEEGKQEESDEELHLGGFLVVGLIRGGCWFVVVEVGKKWCTGIRQER
jgi:hypothetical protein